MSYDPTIGRWLSEDPIGFDGGDANLSRYVGNAPTMFVDPDGLEKYNSNELWTGGIIAGQAQGLPIFLLVWNKENETPIRDGTNSAQYSRFSNAILWTDRITMPRLTRICQKGSYDPTKDAVFLSGLYNEGFHAWFDQSLENQVSGAWLWNIIDGQTQYGWWGRREKAEESMSELIDFIITKLEEGRPVPTYDGAPDRVKIPGHHGKGEKWEGDPEATKPISEELYYATLWLLEHGSENCLPHRQKGTAGAASPLVAGLSDGNILLELKKYFQKKYRPNWSQEEINQFLNATPKPTFDSPWGPKSRATM